MKIREFKKKGFHYEGITKKALDLPDPHNKVFDSKVAIQKNVLLIGKSGVGKTTCFEVLKDACYCTPRGQSLFAGTKDSTYASLVFHNVTGKTYSINVIDTPGLFEVRSSIDGPKRSNEEILTNISIRVREEVTCLSAVFLMFPLTTVLNSEDLQTLEVIKEYLGTSDHIKKISF